MNDEASFLQAMQDRPDDASLRLVFADWLEEQGDPRGEVIRLLHTLTQSTIVPDKHGSSGRLFPYSTFDFGRDRDGACFSVILPEEEARPLLGDLRKKLPPGMVAFLGTSRWLGDEKYDGVELAVGKGNSQFDVLRIARSDACNYDMDTEALISRLQAWDNSFGIDVLHAETDTIEFTLLKEPEDARTFAREVYEFCPDIVDQGLGSVEALEEAIRDYGQVVLWWD